MLLSEARLRVSHFLKDDDAAFPTDQIDQKLQVATEIVAKSYAARGGTLLDDEGTFISTNGLFDLSTQAPLAIRSVQFANGGTFITIPAITGSNFLQTLSGTQTALVRYVTRPVCPTVATDPFLYNGGLVNQIMDECICIVATRLLLVKDDTVSQALETAKAELLDTLLSTENTVRAFDLPSDHGTEQRYGYKFHKYQIQLGVRGR